MATLQNTTIPNGGTLGSVSDPDAISISSGGSVTISQDLNPANFTGMIAPFGRTSAPTGWIVCDGSAVSRSTYASLFSAIGTTWGSGNGSTTFNVPDLRGAYIRGTGTAGVNSDYAGPANVDDYQDDQNASHNHNATSSSSGTTSNAGNHRHNVNTGYGGGIWGKGAASGNVTVTQYTTYAGSHSHNLTVSTSTTVASSGSTEARVYNRGVLYCIKT